MDYLARESADLSDGLWNRIDETVIGTARAQLTCRRFLKVFGPLGAGVTTVAVDGVNKEEVLEDGIGRIVGRTQLELPLFYEDFTLLSRDMEYAAQTGYPLDLSVAIAAAKKASRREDDLILNGSKALGDSLTHGEGSSKVKEEVAGRKQLRRYHRRRRPASQDRLLGPLRARGVARPVPRLAAPAAEHRSAGDRPHQEAHRRQRVHDQRHGSRQGRARVRRARVPGSCHRLDQSVGYLELADFNHTFRIMETAALRVKDPAAIVVFA